MVLIEFFQEIDAKVCIWLKEEYDSGDKSMGRAPPPEQENTFRGDFCDFRARFSVISVRTA